MIFSDQAALEVAFQSWLNDFLVIESGCGGTPMFDETPVAPILCETNTVTLTYAIDDGCTTDDTTASFTITAAEAIILNCPEGPENVSTCDFDNQAELDAYFQNWLDNNFSVTSDGCGAVGFFLDNYAAPSLCAGGTTTVEYGAFDNCTGDTCMIDFIVTTEPPVAVFCPPNVNDANCDYIDQTDLDQAYSDWKALFMVSSPGCSAAGSFGADPGAPDILTGGSSTLTYTAMDQCTTVTCSATFTITASSEVEVSCPGDTVALNCDFADQLTLDAAYEAWKSQFETLVSGCDGQQGSGSFVEDLDAPIYCDGGSVTLRYGYDDGLTNDTCEATFTLNVVDPVSVSGPSDTTVSSCDFADQAALDVAFQTWLDQFQEEEVGCNGQAQFNITPISPVLCEFAEISLTYSIDDGCNTDEVTATFTVAAINPIALFCPQDFNGSNCIYPDQDSLNRAYNNWKDMFRVVHPGCGAIGSFDSDPGPPNRLTGGSSTLTYTAMDQCTTVTCTRTFTINAEDGVTISCPADTVVNACDFVDQAAIEVAFEEWKSRFTLDNIGCGAVGSFVEELPAPDKCAGGTVSLTFMADDGFSQVSCTQSFTVDAPTPITLSCPGNENYPACDFADQAGLNQVFEDWKALFLVTQMGCGTSAPQDLSGIVAPLICEGGTVEINFSYSDDCNTESCIRTFRVSPVPPSAALCPDDFIESACVSSEVSFLNWLSQFTTAGGCNNNVTEEFQVTIDGNTTSYDNIEDIPSLTTCGTMNVKYISTNELVCGNSMTECEASYTLEPDSEIDASCPVPLIIPACTDYEDKFIAWAAGFNYTGGCGNITELFTLTVDGQKFQLNSIEGILPYLPTCGGKIEIDYLVYDELKCSIDGCSSTFEIEEEDPVILACSPDVTVPACENFDEKFADWLGGLKWSGGCDIEVICCIRYNDGPITIVTALDQVPAPSICGEKLNITIKVTSRCQGLFTCSTNFIVEESDPILLTCPANVSLPACTDPAVIQTAYEDWLNTFDHSGGCDISADFVGGVPSKPSRCGGTVEATYMAEDRKGCHEPIVCSATFTVEVVEELIVSCPSDKVIEGCMGQDEVNAEFEAWLESFGYEGSCAPEGIFLGGEPKAPSACGGAIQVTFHIPNNTSCFVLQNCIRSFTVLGSDREPSISGDSIEDLALDCNEEIPSVSSIEATDHCGNSLTLLYSEESSFEESSQIETIIRTWSAEDGCIDGAVAQQTITRRVDTIPPELNLSVPADLTVNCGEMPSSIIFTPTDLGGISDFGMKEDTIMVDDCPAFFKIERTYFAEDECGNRTESIHTITVNSEDGPVFLNTPFNLCEPVISASEFSELSFTPLEALDPCSGLTILSEEPTVEYDCDLFMYKITWIAKGSCAQIGEHVQLICLEEQMPVCQIGVLEEQPCGGITTLELMAAYITEPFSVAWEIVSGDWTEVEKSFGTQLRLSSTSSPVEVKATITDANGCIIICENIFNCSLNGACTFTSQFLSSDELDCEGNSALSIINTILEQEVEPLVIGLDGNSFSVAKGDEACVVDFLGSTEGTASAIEGEGTCSEINFELQEGKSANPLINEALTLALNSKYDPNLKGWRIEDKCVRTMATDKCAVGPNDVGIESTLDTFCFGEKILDKLGSEFLVSDLMNLADSAIAGIDVGINLSEIARALRFVNEAFSGCRIVLDFGDFTDISLTENPDNGKSKSSISKNNGKSIGIAAQGIIHISPNPASSRIKVSLESKIRESGLLMIRDQNGKTLFSKSINLLSGPNNFDLNVADLKQGVYVIQYQNHTRFIVNKFIKG